MRELPSSMPPSRCRGRASLAAGELLLVAITLSALLIGCGAAPTNVVIPTVVPVASAAPTSVPTAAPEREAADCGRPYSDTSPWNTKIGPSPEYDPRSDQYVGAISGPFGSDPTRYSMPVYEVTQDTPLQTVVIARRFSDVVEQGGRVIVQSGGVMRAPIPPAAAPSPGTDAQIVLWNRATGDEWGLWQVKRDEDGTWSAVNGYHYNTNWDGVPPQGFVSRGAGVPYLVGLIRPCEMLRGSIDHALALTLKDPASTFVYPATKSDGKGKGPDALPQGARLQLDPRLTGEQIRAWDCVDACLIVAHAMQTYGMYVIDSGGHPKIVAEDELSAHWSALDPRQRMAPDTVAPIPYTAFKVLALPR